jgi:glycerol-3-phosphate dehydrogenase (NAD(P)+)
LPEAVIIGGGSWGLAFASLMRSNGIEISLWEYNREYVEEIRKTGYNSRLLPGIRIDERIAVTSDIQEAFQIDPDILILAVPSHTMRSVVGLVVPFAVKSKNLKSIVNLAKGIEEETLMRMSEVIRTQLPEHLSTIVSTLSGPSHAEEVARRVPTAVVLAGSNDESLTYTQELISNEYFRIYRSPDIVGVELGGAVKNIIAIASGIVSGLDLGDNTQGALLTRGLSEIRRLGDALGADPNTFNGLSGIGDLITTAFSQHSRNRHVGYQLGRGKKLNDILTSMHMVAEGVKTTRSIYHLKDKLSVTMPITEQIYQVLFNDKPPEEAIRDLMTRELKEED